MDLKKSFYRDDIDGLRAISVLLVLAFHFEIISGGFVGVTSFFVISGYLISKNICSGVEDERFQLSTFYLARFMRIVPAFSCLVVLVVFVGCILTVNDDWVKIVSSSIWSMLGLANMYFWWSTNASYFSDDIKQQPLLHLWSLGVEEQFYILIALSLPLLMRRKYIMFVVLFVLMSMSTIGGLFVSQSMSYYLVVFRMSELLVGVVLTLFLRSYRQIQRSLMLDVLGMISLTVLIVCGFVFSEKTTYPSYNALIPSFATFALIVIGNHCFVNKYILSNKVLVFIGKLSYSIYLIHWVFIAFLKYYRFDVNDGKIILICIPLIFVSSFAMNRLVENPLRKAKVSLFKASMFRILLVVMLICMLTTVTTKEEGIIEEKIVQVENQNLTGCSHDPNIANIARQREKSEGIRFVWKEDVYFSQSFKRVGGINQGLCKFALVGDSHANMMFPLIDESNVVFIVFFFNLFLLSWFKVQFQFQIVK